MKTSRFLKWAVLAGLSLTTTVAAQEANAVLQKAQTALGSVKSIQFSGTGTNAFVGQALAAGKEWPRRPLTSFTETINYDQRSLRQDLSFQQPVFGGQQQNGEVNGDRAWTVGANGPVPQLANADERQLWIWMTPHGFVRGAIAAGNATVKSAAVNGQKVSLVSFTAMNKFKLTGTIDAQGLVTKVETLFANPVLGDMAYVFEYGDYKDYSGVRFPGKIVQTEGGFSANEFTDTAVQPNAAVDLPVPPNVQSATAPAVNVATTKVADGVWFLGGGSHHSVVVEFNNFTTVIEGPLGEERSLAVLTEARRLVPNKPIRYVISTHHHFDHSGGLRTYVAEGITVVTHASNKAYFEKSFTAPATIVPDEQSKAKKKPSIQAVNDKYVITDGKQSIEVYSTVGDQHTDELLVAYIPSAKVLVEADSYSPGPANAPAPSPVPPNALVLWDNIQRLKLDIAIVIGIHGRGPVSFAEFAKFVGKG